jgi:hypothetical protein
MEFKKVAKRFTNWTDLDFSHKWDNVEYNFKAGQSEMLQDYLAHHFAKHLAQREINRKNLLMSDLRYQEYYDKCLSDESSAESSLKLEMEIEKLNKVAEVTEVPKASDVVEAPKKKMGRPKKEEDTFAGK